MIWKVVFYPVKLLAAGLITALVCAAVGLVVGKVVGIAAGLGTYEQYPLIGHAPGTGLGVGGLIGFFVGPLVGILFVYLFESEEDSSFQCSSMILIMASGPIIGAFLGEGFAERVNTTVLGVRFGSIDDSSSAAIAGAYLGLIFGAVGTLIVAPLVLLLSRRSRSQSQFYRD